MSDAYTATQVAWILGLHVNTVKRLDELPYFRVGSRGDRRYRREDVRAYIEQRRTDGHRVVPTETPQGALICALCGKPARTANKQHPVHAAV